MTVYVTKASGKRERFDPRKIERTLRRAGASSDVRRRVLTGVEARLYDGITTGEILKIVKRLLTREERKAGMRYDLKQAIMRLGPAGFAFEAYFAEILEHYGYGTVIGRKLAGRCVVHEIDIIAELIRGERKRILIECKYHNAPGIYTNLKEALYTYMRFLDLAEANGYFDEVWLVTNTKASGDARRFAKCRKMKLITWRYPRGRSLRELIDKKKLYPVTSLPSVDRSTLGKLAEARLVLVKDLLEADSEYARLMTELPSGKLERIKREAEELINRR
ncbi:ATP cone domain-containing protein [Candidatus Pyrohabitans sp.]